MQTAMHSTATGQESPGGMQHQRQEEEEKWQLRYERPFLLWKSLRGDAIRLEGRLQTSRKREREEGLTDREEGSGMNEERAEQFLIREGRKSDLTKVRTASTTTITTTTTTDTTTTTTTTITTTKTSSNHSTIIDNTTTGVLLSGTSYQHTSIVYHRVIPPLPSTERRAAWRA
ncbi:GAL3A protein, partial [Vespula squamosa]